jgi:hypothetical protein
MARDLRRGEEMDEEEDGLLARPLSRRDATDDLLL